MWTWATTSSCCNAEKVRVTGNKLDDKFYHHHTGYLGNLKTIALGKLLEEHPERAIEFAVKGMLPKTTLGRRMFRKLHVSPATSTRTRRSSPSRSKSEVLGNPYRYGSDSPLRYRPAQDFHRACLPAAGQRAHHGQ